MRQIELRQKNGVSSEGDIILNVQDKTYDYLMTSPAAEIRVSAYFDQDWTRVEAEYAEVFVHETCAFETKITKLIPGSKSREGVTLPGPMKEGEQLVILVRRQAGPAAEAGQD